MREASHRSIRACLAPLVSALIGAGSLPNAWATPMEAALAPQTDAGPLESEVELDPGAVSVVEDRIELPEDFEGLLEGPPAGAAQGEAAATSEVGAALDPAPSPAAPGPMQRALAEHHLRLARTMARNGDFQGAAGSAGRAAEISPEAPEARLELGFALLALGRFAEAEAQLRRALELGSDSAPLHAGLARAAGAQDRQRDAIRHGREALRRDPDLVPAANNLAWLLATSDDPGLRDPEESIRIAQHALGLVGGEHPRILDTLAAGYAAAGRYADAVAAAERAEALARSQGDPALAVEIRGHLERYRAGKAYTEK